MFMSYVRQLGLVFLLLLAAPMALADIDKFREDAPSTTIYYADGPLHQLYDYLQQNIEQNSTTVKSWLRVRQYNGSVTNQAMNDFTNLLSESLMAQLLQR